MLKLNLAASVLAAVMLAAALPQASPAFAQVPAGPPLAVPAVSDPGYNPEVDDFVRPEPASGRARSEYTYVSEPLAGTIKTTLVTVELADKTSSATDAAVPLPAATTAMSAAAAYWANATINRVDISVISTKKLHKSAARSTQTPAEIVNIVAKELSWTQSPYTALVMFVPGAYLSNGAAGMAFSDGTTGGRILMPQNSRLTIPVLTHEFGHALGLDHANSLLCGSGAQDVASGPFSGFADSSCSLKTYGDNLDLMGISHWDVMPQISASLWEMGRFGTGREITNLGTLTAARSVTLKPWAGKESDRAAKFTDPKSGEVYYLELRAPVGYDSVISRNGNRGVKITQQGGGNSSILIPPDTRPLAFNGYYSNTQTWQAGQTFTTHAGTVVSINSVSDTSASVTIRPAGNPAKGAFDNAEMSVTSSGAVLTVTGWAVDPATNSASTEARITVTAPDKTSATTVVPADKYRSDVNSALGISGNHGFRSSIDVKQAGSYKVCVDAVAAAGNTGLGCRNVTLAGSPAPVGSLDSVTTALVTGQPRIRLDGWALDRGKPGASIPVRVDVTAPDGTTSTRTYTADKSRPDVNQALGVSGSHGFSITVPVTRSGAYTVCAAGIAVSVMPAAASTSLGCRTITADVTEQPRGFLDSVQFTNSGSAAGLRVEGWSYDAGKSSASIPVHLYVRAPDGRTSMVSTTANKARADVNAAMKITGSHGFRTTVPVTQTGTYRVCAYGIAVSALTRSNAFLGCGDAVAKAAAPPIGYVDNVVVDTRTPSAVMTVSGWSLEQATPSASNAVHIYVTDPNGKTKGYVSTANRTRADVNAAFSVPGRHGFKYSVPITQSGRYRVCTYGIAVSPLSAGNTLLDCRDVTAQAAAAPAGYLDAVRVAGAGSTKSLKATGWTVDPNFTSRSVPVNISVKFPDSTSKTYKFTANVARPDVNAALNIAGNHGYSATVPISARGSYTVCASSPGIAVLSTGVSQLGCLSVRY